MGIKERQERERVEARRKILDAARELFVTDGYHNVSIRKVAEKAEYSPASLYGYFPSKDDLFFALAEEGFRKLFEFTNAQIVAAAGPGDPIEALREGFLRYYRFSRQHREYFELMFVDRTVPSIARNWQRFAFVNEMIDEICQAIQRAVDAGQLPPATDPHAAFHVLWGAVHGPAVLALCSRCAPDEDPDLLVGDTLEAVLAGLRAGTPLKFKPSQLHHSPGASAGSGSASC
jgi:AcrR family transcriptional regulator